MTNDQGNRTAQAIVPDGLRDYAELPLSQTIDSQAIAVPFVDESDMARGASCCNDLICLALENLTWMLDSMGKARLSAQDGR